MNSPFLLYAFIDEVSANASFFGPFGYRHGFTLKRYHVYIAAILTLLLPGGPSAIRRPAVCEALITMSTTIVAIVVNAVNRVLIIWSFTHIANKTLKRFLPRFTDADTTASISLVARIRFCVASLLHLHPYTVLGSKIVSMLGISIGDALKMVTPTALCMTCRQFTSVYNSLVAAIAPAKPFTFANVADGDQAAISNIGAIYEVGGFRMGNKLNIIHKAIPLCKRKPIYLNSQSQESPNSHGDIGKWVNNNSTRMFDSVQHSGRVWLRYYTTKQPFLPLVAGV